MKLLYRYSPFIAASAAFVPIIVIACQSQPTGDTSLVTSKQAVQSSSTNLNYSLPENWSADKTVIVGTDRVDVADRAVITSSGANIVSLGTEPLRIGVGAKVPSIWAKGGVALANDSTVNGTIESAVAPSIGTNVTISGTTTIRSEAPNLVTQIVSLDFGLCNNNVMIEPGQSREISAGSWGDIFVKQGSTLHLSPGGYTLRSLTVEPGGNIIVHSSGSSVNIAIQNSLTFRGSVVYPYTTAALTFTVAGNDVTVDTALTATIIAPNARVAINAKQGSFSGRIYGRDVYVAPDVTISHSVPSTGAFDPVDTPAPTLEEMNLPTTAGAPPNLTDTTISAAVRAESFITWVQRSTESDLENGRNEIAKIRNDTAIKSALVSETWASINTKRLSRALVALEVLTELDTDESEAVFSTLVAQPAPGTGTWSTEDGMTDDDRAHSLLQAKSVLGLGWRRSTTAKDILKSLSLTHPSELVRSEAIRVYVLYYGTAGRDELEAVLPTSVKGQLDTFESTDADGRPYAVREAEYLAKHPETVMLTEPVDPIEPDDNANVCAIDNEED